MCLLYLTGSFGAPFWQSRTGCGNTTISGCYPCKTGAGAFMAGSELPKLFINADPGSILVGPQREFCRSWPNQQEVTVKGLHFIQEDSPVEIGQAVASWLKAI